MAYLSRGKRAVKQSLMKSCQPKKSRSRGMTPIEEAEFWISSGLDKDCFEVKYISKEIGSGVFALTNISKGSFLLQYAGELITESEAVSRERKTYSKEKRSYLYFFKHEGKKLCIDASRTYGRMGRMANDNISPNARMKKINIPNSPIAYLALFAIKDITSGEEIVYNYGVDDLPWRNKKIVESDSEYDSDPFGLRENEAESSLEYCTENCNRFQSEAVVTPQYSQDSDNNSSLRSDSEANPQASVHIQDSGSRNGQESEPQSDEQFLKSEAEVTQQDTDDTMILISNSEPHSQESVQDSGSRNGQEYEPQSDEQFLESEAEVTQQDTTDDTMILISDSEPHSQESVQDTGSKNGQESEPQPDEQFLKSEAEVTQQHTDDTMILISNSEPHSQESVQDSGSKNGQESEPQSDEQFLKSEAEVTQQDTDDTMILISDSEPHSQESVQDSGSRNGQESEPQPDQQYLETQSHATVDPFKAKQFTDNMQTMFLSEVTGEFCILSNPVPGIDESIENSCSSCDSDIFPDYGLSKEESLISTHESQLTMAKNRQSEIESQYVLVDRENGQLRNDQMLLVDDVADLQRKVQTKEDRMKKPDDPYMIDFMCWVCHKHFKRKGGLTTHMKMHLKDGADYKKPKRMCPFCYVDQCDLTRHLVLCHSDVPEVENAAKLPKGTEERNLAFAGFRKEGIFKHNKKQASLENPQYVAERPVCSDIVACTKCKGFYSRALFYRHKERCIQDSATVPSQLHIEALKGNDEFAREILSKFHQDEVGNICRTDSTIVLIGRRLFQRNLRKVDKTMEIKKSVMSDMRVLGRLYVAFKEISTEKTTGSEDMFIRTNFEALEQSIDKVTKDDDGKLKYGTKHQLYYLIKSSVDFIIGSHLSNGEDSKAKEIEKFAKLLVLNRDLIFGDATYAINLSRQESLRMPEQQAEEEEIDRLHQYIRKTIKTQSSEFTFVGLHEFVLLRDSLCARLTLFNARRGGEPSRLKLTQLQDAFSGRWIDKKAIQKLEDWEQKLFTDMLIAYQPGKGNHLVPVLIPRDVIQPLRIITDKEVRERASVHRNNIFVFAMTELSMNHVHGWASIDKMSKDASCVQPELLTASKQRHRISTMYCALEVPETDRDYFYKHMGHTKQVNVGTYQYPLPVLEITKVGRHLQVFDECTSKVKGEREHVEPCRESEHVDLHVHVDENKTPKTKKAKKKETPTMPKRKEKYLRNTDEETSSSSDDDTDMDVGTKSGNRTYFRWDDRLTNQIKMDFSKWTKMPKGNSLPSKKDLLQYLEGHQIGCSYKQLRTKIMNEQNKQRRLLKKRCSQMNMGEL